MDRAEFHRLLRRVLKTAVPVAMLGAGSLFVDGCYCPSENRTTVVPVASRPASFQECISMCTKELLSHYDSARLQDESAWQPWSLGEVRRCEVTTLLQSSENNTSSTLQNALICEYEVYQVCVGGRLPAGLQPQEQTDVTNELGQYFAKLCFLEQAAVVAFEVLALELETHSAPQGFIERAWQAVQEEKEHAEMTALLTQMFGAEAPEVSVDPQPVRSLEEIAYENAVEGCVRETYAPLAAHWQSLHSVSPEVRAVMGRIAEEESGHAALSWEVDAWISPQLTSAQQAKKDQLQREAVAELGQQIQSEPSQTMVDLAGLPSALSAQKLFDGLQRELWS
ncbi:MAG: ferritin-like domain-containing protein [Deltaproteobacteria bacterium]|nr:MAG: ferritin-like domain-containing protein [Deltaproteobacteria bacterium]